METVCTVDNPPVGPLYPLGRGLPLLSEISSTARNKTKISSTARSKTSSEIYRLIVWLKTTSSFACIWIICISCMQLLLTILCQCHNKKGVEAHCNQEGPIDSHFHELSCSHFFLQHKMHKFARTVISRFIELTGFLVVMWLSKYGRQIDIHCLKQCADCGVYTLVAVQWVRLQIHPFYFPSDPYLWVSLRKHS